ncbi:hypothetical protein C8Q80DRAFT_1115176 [Daedaleopsis nitida]|nr:hypothetical protein C8Q80DRAFT_1115176 [Daedaleopsis nitida]
MSSQDVERGPRKRRRLESEGIDTQPVKDAELWLPDGNIVVISRNVAFRIHKSILSRHSEIFCDLFSLPQHEVDETMDDCPTVHLDADDPDDLRPLFQVICCGKNYYHQNDDMTPVPFSILASLIRMGHKYNIPTVLNDALSRLKKYYTADFNSWRDCKARKRYVSTTSLDAMTVIKLAHLTDTPSLLPIAYFVCCDLIAETYSDDSDKAAQLILADLAPEDPCRILTGSTHLVRHAAMRISAFLTAIPSADCKSPQRCDTKMHLLLIKRLEDGTAYQKLAHRSAIEPMAAWLVEDPALPLCGACVENGREFDIQQCRCTWEELPRFFGVEVPDWPRSTL